VLGPHVSVGDKCEVNNSVVRNSIIQTNTKVNDALIDNAMIGNYCQFTGKVQDLSMGDYSTQS
jgi:glucose-1-phosphate thymidylyltransferase